jgi:hypothetical protein
MLAAENARCLDTAAVAGTASSAVVHEFIRIGISIEPGL